MNLEIAYSDLMNLRLHNNIHVFILSLKVNNASATFIIMIQVAHAKPIHSFHDSNFHNIFSSIYKVLNHKNNDYYIISKIIRNPCTRHEYDHYNQYSANTHYYATTVIFNISHSLLSIEASLL